MLSIEFMIGAFGTAFISGLVVGKQLLIFKRAVEISTSNNG